MEDFQAPIIWTLFHVQRSFSVDPGCERSFALLLPRMSILQQSLSQRHAWRLGKRYVGHSYVALAGLTREA